MVRRAAMSAARRTIHYVVVFCRHSAKPLRPVLRLAALMRHGEIEYAFAEHLIHQRDEALDLVQKTTMPIRQVLSRHFEQRCDVSSLRRAASIGIVERGADAGPIVLPKTVRCSQFAAASEVASCY